MGGVGCDDLRVANHPASCSLRERLPAIACAANSCRAAPVDIAVAGLTFVDTGRVDIVLVNQAPVDLAFVETTTVNQDLGELTLVDLALVDLTLVDIVLFDVTAVDITERGGLGCRSLMSSNNIAVVAFDLLLVLAFTTNPHSIVTLNPREILVFTVAQMRSLLPFTGPPSDCM